MLQKDLQNSANRLLALTAYIPALEQQLLMSRDREGAVLFRLRGILQVPLQLVHK